MRSRSQHNLLGKTGICLLINGVILWFGAGFVFLNISNYYDTRLSQAALDFQESRRLSTEQERLLRPVSLLGSVGSVANSIGIVFLLVNIKTYKN